MIKLLMKWFSNLFVVTKDSPEYLWVQKKINRAFSGVRVFEIEPFWVVEDKTTRVNIAHTLTYKGQKYLLSGIRCEDLFSNPKEVICPTDKTYFELYALAHTLNCNDPKGSTTLIKSTDGRVSAFSLPEGLDNLGILVTPVN